MCKIHCRNQPDNFAFSVKKRRVEVLSEKQPASEETVQLLPNMTGLVEAVYSFE